MKYSPLDSGAISALRADGKWHNAWRSIVVALSSTENARSTFQEFEIWMDHVSGRFSDTAGEGDPTVYTDSEPGFALWTTAKEILHLTRTDSRNVPAYFDEDRKILTAAAARIVSKEWNEAVAPTIHFIEAACESIRCAWLLKALRDPSHTTLNPSNLATSITEAVNSYHRFIDQDADSPTLQLEFEKQAGMSIDATFNSYLRQICDGQSSTFCIAVSMLQRSVGWLLDITATESRPTQYSQRLWVLLVGHLDTEAHGTCAQLHTQPDDSAFSVLYPDPIFLGVVFFDEEWQKSFENAARSVESESNNSGGYRWHVSFLGASTEEKLARKWGMNHLNGALRRYPELGGNSASAALACLLNCSIDGQPIYRRVAITASVDPHSCIGPVGGLLPKVGKRLWLNFLSAHVDHFLVYGGSGDPVSEWIRSEAAAVSPDLLHCVDNLEAAFEFYLGKQQSMHEYSIAEARFIWNKLGLIVPQRLEDIDSHSTFVALHVPLSVTEGAAEDAESMPLMEAVRKWRSSPEDVLIIKGPPGAGKTWSSSHLALALQTESRQHGSGLAHLPIWMTASELFGSTFGVTSTMTEAITRRIREHSDRVPDEQQTSADSVVDTYFRAANDKRIIWIIDGFDEYADVFAEKKIKQVLRFGRVILFSRPDSRLPVDSRTTEKRLEPLDKLSVSNFVTRWFEGDEEGKETFLRDVCERDQYRAMIRTPIFAAVMCWLWADRKRLSHISHTAHLTPSDNFPIIPAELLQLFVTAYLTKGYRNDAEFLTPEALWRDVLPILSWQALEDFNGKRWAVTRNSPVGELIVNNRLGRGLFVANNKDSQFVVVHQIFCEWLAAMQLRRTVIQASPNYWGAFLAQSSRSLRIWAPEWQTMLATYLQLADTEESQGLVDFLLDNCNFSQLNDDHVGSLTALQSVCMILSGAQFTRPELCQQLMHGVVESHLETFTKQTLIFSMCQHGGAAPMDLGRWLQDQYLSKSEINDCSELLQLLKIVSYSLGRSSSLAQTSDLMKMLGSASTGKRRYVIAILQAVIDVAVKSATTALEQIHNLLAASDHESILDLKIELLPRRSLVREISSNIGYVSRIFCEFESRFCSSTDSEYRCCVARHLSTLSRHLHECSDSSFLILFSEWLNEDNRECRRSLKTALVSMAPLVSQKCLDETVITLHSREIILLVSEGDSVNVSNRIIFNLFACSSAEACSQIFESIILRSLQLSNPRRYLCITKYISELLRYAPAEFIPEVLDLAVQEIGRHVAEGNMIRAELVTAIAAPFTHHTTVEQMSAASDLLTQTAYGVSLTSEHWERLLHELIDQFVLETDPENQRDLEAAMTDTVGGVNPDALCDVVANTIGIMILQEDKLGEVLGQGSLASYVGTYYGFRRQCCRVSSLLLPRLTPTAAAEGMVFLKEQLIEPHDSEIGDLILDCMESCAEGLEFTDANRFFKDLFAQIATLEGGLGYGESSLLIAIIHQLDTADVSGAMTIVLDHICDCSDTLLGQEVASGLLGLLDEASRCRPLPPVITVFERLISIAGLRVFREEWSRLCDISGCLIEAMADDELSSCWTTMRRLLEVSGKRSADEKDLWVRFVGRVRRELTLPRGKVHGWLVRMLTALDRPCDFETVADGLQAVTLPEDSLELSKSIEKILPHLADESARFDLTDLVERMSQNLDADSADQTFRGVLEFYTTADRTLCESLSAILCALCGSLSIDLVFTLLSEGKNLPPDVVFEMSKSHRVVELADGNIVQADSRRLDWD